MVFFEWKEEYELGLPQIDLQHTMIVNMLNELHLFLDTGEEESATEKILAKLLGYVEDHFATEERTMRENKYHDLPSHLAEHEAFREKVNGFHDRHQAGGKIAVCELTVFLKNWLQEHIAQVDKTFGVFVHQLSEDARAAFLRQNPTHPFAK